MREMRGSGVALEGTYGGEGDEWHRLYEFVLYNYNYGTTKFLRVLPSSHSDTGCSCWCVHVKCSEF